MPANWAPLLQAKAKVENYPDAPLADEPGAQITQILYDQGSAKLQLRLQGQRLPSRCPRFSSRACPRMAPMGHEPSHGSCNYWDYPRMEALLPRLELYPEWQRFDCHKYYCLFQSHLVGEELALSLGAQASFVWVGRPEEEALLKAYASLSSRPEAFVFELEKI
jgi:hypothetical protein